MSQPPGFTPPPGKSEASPKEDNDESLDEALRESFPASDPIAVDGKAHPHGGNQPRTNARSRRDERSERQAKRP